MLLVAVGLYGAAIGYYGAALDRDPPKIVDRMVTLAVIILTYVWYHVDAAEREFRRTMALGAGVILLAVVAIPYYLLRSRPSGQKARALFRFLAFLGVLVGVGAAAAALTALMA